MAEVLTPPHLYQTTRIKPGSLLAVYREPNSRGDVHIVIDLQKNEAMISQKIPALVARIGESLSKEHQTVYATWKPTLSGLGKALRESSKQPRGVSDTTWVWYKQRFRVKSFALCDVASTQLLEVAKMWNCDEFELIGSPLHYRIV